MGARPSRIGGYRVVRALGVGRHGRTFEAERNDLRRVALREIKCDQLAAAGRIEQGSDLHHLCTIIDGLTHDALADTLEVFALGRCVYVAEEYLREPPLSDVLKEAGHLPVEEAWAIVCQVLAGLEFGHQRGLLHLDLRTANVHHDRSAKRTMLTDFGHMQLLLELRPAWSLARMTDGYSAPELRTGQPPTPASEVYSVGVILHELITGLLPRGPHDSFERARFDFIELEGSAEKRSADEIVNELEVQWPGVIHVMERALSEKPADRYQRAAHMQSALASAYRADVSGEGYIEAEVRERTADKPASEERETVRVEGEIQFCEACGRPLAPEGKVCIACGAVVADEKPVEREVTPDPPAERSYFQRHADRLMVEGRFADAEKAYEMAVRRAPLDAVAHRDLGDVLVINRKFLEARGAYQEALRLDPSDMLARYQMARVMLSEGDGPQAIVALGRLLDDDPPEAMRLSALTQLGAAFASVGNHDAARERWAEVLAQDQGNARVHYAVATTYLASDDEQNALEHLRAAVAADPEYPEAARALERVEGRSMDANRWAARERLSGARSTHGSSVPWESTMLTEALSRMGASLGREHWGARASRSTWQWTTDSGWEQLASSTREWGDGLLRPGPMDRSVEHNEDAPDDEKVDQ